MFSNVNFVQVENVKEKLVTVYNIDLLYRETVEAIAVISLWSCLYINYSAHICHNEKSTSVTCNKTLNQFLDLQTLQWM